MRPNYSKAIAAALFMVAALSLTACGSSDNEPAPPGGEPGQGGGNPGGGKLSITTPGARPGMLSGNKALVAIARSRRVLGPGLPPYDAGDLTQNSISVMLNGQNVTARFKKTRLNGGGTALLGLVAGLNKGANTLTVRGDDGAKASLTLTDYPISGPIFSGPHEEFFICQTQASGLGPPQDKQDCSAPTKVHYVYLTSDTNTFENFDPDGPRPSDIATTTTSTGHKVPFIVRLEKGVINRAIYQIAILDDPARPGPDPWTITSGWNGRLVYLFGGGCGSGHHQGTAASSPKVLKKGLLEEGYAVATSTLNALSNNCNAVLSAETALMVKEHFAETLGVPVYTIGNGRSGGAIQQYMIADNYPGILDGITPGDSFPDYMVQPGISDCGLLVHYFKNSTRNWTPQEKTAVSGEGTFGSCKTWNRSPALKTIKASVGCDKSIPPNLIFDARTNPGGIRCTFQDHLVNILGTDPDTGYARRPLDNIGVQYGLEALNNGLISEAQFIDLNKNIGGYNINGKIVTQREKANIKALNVIYATGGLTTAEGGLPTTPIIDHRIYRDPSGNIHTSFYSFSTRKRLLATAGTASNQVMLVAPHGYPRPVSNNRVIGLMDQWLSNIRGDESGRTLGRKIADDKPDGLSDACFDRNGDKITEPASYGSTDRCNQLYPPHGDPRMGAGEPVSLNILKCQLKSVHVADYAPDVHFSDKQLSTLKAIFPKGVCGWSKPSVGKVPYQGTWSTFGGSAAPK